MAGCACPVALCLNPVEDPFAPCSDCLAAFGPYLRLSGREISTGERAVLGRRAEAKAARIASPAPVRRPPRLSGEDLAEEALHLIRGGVSREEAARRLGVSRV